MEPKRRALLALRAIVEHWRGTGIRTITPELLLATLDRIAESKTPESDCQATGRGCLERFLLSCTRAELTVLLLDYERQRMMDFFTVAERALGMKMPPAADVSAGPA